MRIGFLIAGSRGDIQPAVALGKGLKEAGYEVRLVTFTEFQGLVEQHGLEFFPIRLDMASLLEKYGRPDLFDSGGINVRFLPELIRVFSRMYEKMTSDFLAASQDASAVIGCPATGYLGYAIAGKLGIPYINSSVLPMAPTRAFPSIFWPRTARGMKAGWAAGWLNLASHHLFQGLSWLGMRGLVNRCRRDVLGLPAIPFLANAGRLEKLAVPTLVGFSKGIIPRPSDWGEHIHLTGYWFLDTPGYQPPDELQAFLQSGPAPVYVGFGSMPSKSPEKMTEMVTTALGQAGERGILFTGRGILGQGLAKHAAGSDVLCMDSVPHDWLFPRMVALVHHGGSGTTAAGLRAGIPAVVVPVVSDQLLWAQRVYEIGVGPRPIPRAGLTVESLANAITLAVSDRAMREQATRIGSMIRAEDGVGNAVRVITQILDAANASMKGEKKKGLFI